MAEIRTKPANCYMDDSCFYIQFAFLLKKQRIWLYYLIKRKKLKQYVYNHEGLEGHEEHE